MGTRSITKVSNKHGTLVALYRQFDGYPSAHGLELAKFLAPLIVVNGMRGDTKNVANGAGCLAAQMVAHFKKEAGQFYLSSPDCKEGEDYDYFVDVAWVEATADASDPVTVRVVSGAKEIFNGNRGEFLAWCEDGGDDDADEEEE
jgi:hypothetical protein